MTHDALPLTEQQQLQRAGLRITPVRVYLLRRLCKLLDTPQSSAGLHRQLSYAFPFSTVYRALKDLEKSGLVQRRMCRGTATFLLRRQESPTI